MAAAATADVGGLFTTPPTRRKVSPLSHLKTEDLLNTKRRGESVRRGDVEEKVRKLLQFGESSESDEEEFVQNKALHIRHSPKHRTKGHQSIFNNLLAGEGRKSPCEISSGTRMIYKPECSPGRLQEVKKWLRDSSSTDTTESACKTQSSVGAFIVQDGCGILYVNALAHGSPAAFSNIRIGDELIGIDGSKITKVSCIHDVRCHILGPAGTSVRLCLQRRGGKSGAGSSRELFIYEVTLQRTVVSMGMDVGKAESERQWAIPRQTDGTKALKEEIEKLRLAVERDTELKLEKEMQELRLTVAQLNSEVEREKERLLDREMEKLVRESERDIEFAFKLAEMKVKELEGQVKQRTEENERARLQLQRELEEERHLESRIFKLRHKNALKILAKMCAMWKQKTELRKSCAEDARAIYDTWIHYRAGRPKPNFGISRDIFTSRLYIPHLLKFP